MRRKVTYDAQRDYYTLLGIDSTTTTEGVRQAYRRAVREVHPDLNPHRSAWATEQIQLVNEAYDVLRSTSRRREYDRLRWAHIPQQADQAGIYRHHRPFPASAFEPDLPWWEQATAQGAHAMAAQARARRRARDGTDTDRPLWLILSDWLKDHRLGSLQSTWLTLVGLWRSPYANLIAMLAVALSINLAVLVYMFITPGDRDLLDRWRSALDVTEPTGSPTPDADEAPGGPDRLNQSCLDSGVEIQIPVRLDVVGDTFSVYGSVQHPDIWNYTVMVGYLGQTLNLNPMVSEWTTARLAPENQSIPEQPVEDGLLTAAPVDLSGQSAGLYVVRVQIRLRNGLVLAPCDVIIQH